MIESFGADYAAPLLSALATPAQVSVRANALKGYAPPAGADLVPWWPQGFYLDERPLFAADPAWHQGLYYVQEASSMIYTEAVRRVAALVASGEPLRYLDACAAPGGKTISALAALSPDDFVVANELDRHRANILYENIARYGATNVGLSRGDALRYSKLKEAFDIIAVDAPCSGEGMMRKEPEAVAQWSPSLIASCAAVQREILAGLWRALKPGGVLIYSTCTFNRSENEENIDRLIAETGATSLDLGLDTFTGVRRGIGTDSFCYRLSPGHVRGEGIFIAAVRKPGECRRADGKDRKTAPCSAFAKAHVAASDELTEVMCADRLEVRPRAHARFIASLEPAVSLMRGGLPVAITKGRDMVPVHDLALSAALIPGSFPLLELDYAAALDFLRGESMSDIPSDLPRGFFTPAYAGVPLGFAKNIGRRANNLMPDALRLRLDPRGLSQPEPLVVPQINHQTL